MAAGATFSDDRRALDKILREVRKLRSAAVTVGVHGDSGARTDGELSNVDVARIHEFGQGKIPERSFLRSTVDANGADLLKHAQKVAGKVALGTMPASQALDSVGVVIVGAVQSTISAGIAPALAPATIASRMEKGSHGGGLASKANATTPLVDSGQLIRSIQYRVTGAGSAGGGE